jgi:hypothetical protein
MTTYLITAATAIGLGALIIFAIGLALAVAPTLTQVAGG